MRTISCDHCKKTRKLKETLLWNFNNKEDSDIINTLTNKNDTKQFTHDFLNSNFINLCFGDLCFDCFLDYYNKIRELYEKV